MQCNVYDSVTGITPAEAVLPYLERELGYYHRLYDHKARRYRSIWQNTYRLEGDILWIPAGLWPKVNRSLLERQFQFTVADYRDSLPIPDMSHVDWGGLRAGQAEGLEAIALNHMGVIEHPTGMGKTYLIVQICQMYPHSNIVVTTKARSVVKTIVTRLMNVGIRPGVMGCSTNTLDRITVSTYKSLERVDRSNCNLLLADEVHGAAARVYADVIAGFPIARRFGFSASVEGRSDGADLVVECLFGPKLANVTYQEGVDADTIVPIEAWLVECDQGPRDLPKFQAAADRLAIWCNPGRNAKIAASCRVALERLGSDAQILVMVDKVRHAFELRKLLPDYALVYGGMTSDDRERLIKHGLMDSNEKAMTDSQRMRAQEDFETGRVRRAIATGVWKEGVDFVDLRVLVRADGSAASIASTQIPGRLSRKAPGKDKGILIDIIDTFHKTYLARTERRLAVYRKHGWKQCVLTV